MVTPTSFFGFGSLVNTKTHVYENARTATVFGWQRVWCQSAERDLAFLSVQPAKGIEIQGLIADVPNNDWAALDLREYGYTRETLAEWDVHPTQLPIHMYVADPAHVSQSGKHRALLLSYLDCVVQGFLEVYGEAGATAFFNTTAGWDTPILDDRSAPIYPRRQVLTQAETHYVDVNLARLSAQVKQL